MSLNNFLAQLVQEKQGELSTSAATEITIVVDNAASRRAPNASLTRIVLPAKVGEVKRTSRWAINDFSSQDSTTPYQSPSDSCLRQSRRSNKRSAVIKSSSLDSFLPMPSRMASPVQSLRRKPQSNNDNSSHSGSSNASWDQMLRPPMPAVRRKSLNDKSNHDHNNSTSARIQNALLGQKTALSQESLPMKPQRRGSLLMGLN